MFEFIRKHFAVQAEKDKKKRTDGTAADTTIFADVSSPSRLHSHSSHNNNVAHSSHSGPGVPAEGGHSDGGHGHSCGGHSCGGHGCGGH
jgi:hypothetical protein